MSEKEQTAVEKLLGKSGMWLRPDNVKVGDLIEILDAPVLDDQTFAPRAYLVCNGKLLRTGETFKIRLGPKNVARIAEVFGKDEKKWVGRKLEVISIETYPGLGKRGILFRGVAEGGKEAGSEPAKPAGVQLSPETIDTIRKSRDIAEMGIPLNESDFSVLPAGVRAELLKHGFVEKRVEGDTTYYFFVKEKCQPYFAEGE